MLILLFCSVFSGKSFSQIYVVNNYSVENGLPTSFIYDVTQDNIGRMWFATAAGITIYDGLTWTNLSKKDSLPNIAYRKIFADEKGIIWALPLYMCEKLVYFSNDSMKIVKLPEIRKENFNFTVTSLYVEYENEKPVVYVGTFNGIYIFKDSIWKNINASDGLKDNYVLSFSVFNKKLYVATQQGVSVIESGKVDNSIQNIFSGKYINPIAIGVDKSNTSGEKLWAVGKNWIGYVENNSLVVVNENFRLPEGFDFEFPSVCFGKNDVVYFGNYYFTFYLNKITKEIFPLSHQNGFKSDGNTSIFIDREGNIWRVGARGIDKMNNMYLVNYNTDNGLLEDEVSTIYEYSPGKLILGHNKGLTFFSKDNIKKIDFPEINSKYPGNIRVLDICSDKQGIIWFAGSTSGLGKMNYAGNISWIKIPGSKYISSVAVDKSGTVWITTENGIFVKNGERFVEPANLKIIKQYYRRIFIYDDEMYFASSTVLARLKNNEIKYFASKENSYANDIFSVLKNNNGQILLGTKDGLYELVNEDFVKYYVNGFSINNPVYSVIQDKNGNYWFGTNDGVIEWDGISKTRSFVKANGLAGNEINRSAFCPDNSGNIWVGTESGLSCFRPEYNNLKIPVPTVLLLNAEDPLGEKHSLLNDFKIKSDIKSLSFNFRGISYYNEQFLKYKIKLDGFDADWYEVSQQSIDNIRYTNLKPGDYRFLVSVKNISGEWSNVFSSALITIDKPYYRKLWFILLVLIVFAFLLYMIYKLYLTRIYYINLENKVRIRTAKLSETEKELRNTQAFLEEKVKERTDKLRIANEQLKELNASKDKFFSIIAHDLKSPFVGLLGYSELLKNELDELPKERIREYSENLHKSIKNTYNLLENLLYWALLQTKGMAFKEQKLDLYLEIKSILETFDANLQTKNIKLFSDVKMNLCLDADKNMFRTILHNLISNAIKYTNPGGIVKVSALEKNGSVKICVSDNGVGMDESVKDKLFKLNESISTKGTAKERGTGLGLILIKEMVDFHNGIITVESEPGKGTTFCLSFPRENEQK